MPIHITRNGFHLTTTDILNFAGTGVLTQSVSGGSMFSVSLANTPSGTPTQCVSAQFTSTATPTATGTPTSTPTQTVTATDGGGPGGPPTVTPTAGETGAGTACATSIADAFSGVTDPLPPADWTQAKWIGNGGELWSENAVTAVFVHPADGGEYETTALHTDEFCWSDMRASCDVDQWGGNTGTSRVGLGVRFSSSNPATATGYVGAWERGAGVPATYKLIIYKVASGVKTTLIERQIDAVEPTALRFNVRGSTLSLQVDYLDADAPSTTATGQQARVDCVNVFDTTYTTGRFGGIYGYMEGFNIAQSLALDDFSIVYATSSPFCCRSGPEDNFDRANEDPIAPWNSLNALGNTDFVVSGNQAEMVVPTPLANTVTLMTWPEDICTVDVQSQAISSSSVTGTPIRQTHMTIRQADDTSWADSYRFVGTHGTGVTRIDKIVGGAVTTLATGTGAAGGATTYKFSADGTALKVFVGGVLKIATSDASITTGKFAGLAGFLTTGVTVGDKIIFNDWTLTTI